MLTLALRLLTLSTGLYDRRRSRLDRRSGNSIPLRAKCQLQWIGRLAYPIGILSANPYARSRCMP